MAREGDPRPSILILRAGQPPPEVERELGDFPAWIARTAGNAWDGEFRTHDLRDETTALPPLGSAAAFVITGSASSVTERAPWMLRAEEYVRAMVGARRPLFGICFGHQLVAQALGGEVRRNPRGREIGTVVARRASAAADDALLAGLGEELDVNMSHVDTVSRLPPESRLLLTSALDQACAYAIGDAVRCVQFHPEFAAAAMRGYLRARAALIRDEGGDPEALARAVRTTAEGATGGAETLRNFLRTVALGPSLSAA